MERMKRRTRWARMAKKMRGVLLSNNHVEISENGACILNAHFKAQSLINLKRDGSPGPCPRAVDARLSPFGRSRAAHFRYVFANLQGVVSSSTASLSIRPPILHTLPLLPRPRAIASCRCSTEQLNPIYYYASVRSARWPPIQTDRKETVACAGRKRR